MDSRVSTCCEFRHKCGKMLGSKSSHFRLVKLKGGQPCDRSGQCMPGGGGGGGGGMVLLCGCSLSTLRFWHVHMITLV